MTDYKDIKGLSLENIVDTGTEGTKVATGTTAQQGTTAGQFRYNSTTGKFEGRNASNFIALEGTPTVTSVDDTEVDSAGGGNQTFVITGTNFSSGDTAKFVGDDATTITASSTTVDSATQITAVIAKSSFDNAKEPYDVKVISSGGLSGVLENQINVDNAPTWTTASGTLGTLDNGEAGSNLTTMVVTDADGDSITLAVQSGAIPTGLTLQNDGTFSGTPDEETANTTYNFTIRATANTKTADRAFSCVVKAAAVYAFTADTTWTVPTGITEVSILVVAGGGAGGTASNGGQSYRGSGGGAGGLIYISNYDVTGSASYTIDIGNGGLVSAGNSTSGQNTTFSGGSKTLTANGGGHGGFSDNTNNGESGGSGGGQWYPGYSGEPGTQPANTSDGVNTYNSTGYGNAGGTSGGSPGPYGSGGGGATGVGQNWNAGQQGGTGYDASAVFGTTYGESGNFASGGTSARNGQTNTNTRIGGGGEGHNDTTNIPSDSAANGQVNTGGGGGAGGHGGSGIILIKY